jgi:gliding motility-associated lipoprotein GldH
MAKWLSFFSLIVVLASCTNDIVVSESKSLPGYWDKEEQLEFQIPQLDTLKKYNIFLNLRNTNDYPFNNLFLIVSMEFPHGKTLVDTLEYRMAHPNGEWMGGGIGNVKENKLWYKENVSFFEQGNYNITITHAVRNNGDVEGVSRLEGITDVGYSIEESKEE